MTSDEDSGKLHEELVEGHRLYGRLEGDWFIIEQVGSPPPLVADWEGTELTDEGPASATIVDSTPTRQGPPSSTTSTRSPSSARTCAAVVGLSRPKRFARCVLATPRMPAGG